MPRELEGLRVLLLGASGGLGGAVVAAFLNSGARLAGTSRKWTAAPDGLIALNADLTRRGEAERTVESAIDAMGGLDAAVHLTGGFAMDGTIAETSIDTFDRMLDLNLRAAFSVFRAAVPAVSHGRGRLIAIGSLAALTPGPGLSAYAASKAGLHTLIQVLAAEGRTAGYTANAILPSTIDTPANRAAMPGADFTRWVPPARIAGKLVWLVSAAGAGTNGALIPMEGA
jgi:NAD(P)-dependent dehydrogenase (short-subunit alcohol dehydrogenase family)